MKYITKNEIVCDVVNDFYDFHDYLFDYNFLEDRYKCVFDLRDQKEDEKLKLYFDCESQLLSLKEYFLYTNKIFDKIKLHGLLAKCYNILELMILIKPYVKRKDITKLFDRQLEYDKLFFRTSSVGRTRQATENSDNKEFNKTLELLIKEYETKANFYTATESKLKKHYTQEDWFIVGLKFVDGTVYECKVIKRSGYELVALIFKEEFLNLEKEKINILKNRYRNPINGSLDIDGYKDRTLFKKDDKHENQWHQICNYHKEQGGEIDRRFIEQFSKIYSTLIE